MAELQERPYPNIEVHLIDTNKACLILTTEAYGMLHLTMRFADNYPLSAPEVTIQTFVQHPNVYRNFICATILNTEEEYTPAYTLKGICIQMLSFFASDSLEQEHGRGGVVRLEEYRQSQVTRPASGFQCEECGFAKSSRPLQPNSRRGKKMANKQAREESATASEGEWDGMDMDIDNYLSSVEADDNPSSMTVKPSITCPIGQLPDECLLEIVHHLDFEDVMVFSRSWTRVELLIRIYDVVRCRDLQCFVLKETYHRYLLGVGVSVSRKGTIESEFDLLSSKAYDEMKIRKAIHGMPFQHWLPLPISQRHWRLGEEKAKLCLSQLSVRLSLPAGTSRANVLFHFMNDIVVRLNSDLREEETEPKPVRDWWSPIRHTAKSTLRHASEKAIEAYFHLYHILLCIATSREGHAVVAAANRMIQSFLAGKRDKTHVPNLGHLLVALHISDVQVTTELTKAIIIEAITRNVVWLLDGKGAGYAELGFLETDAVSKYRLAKTFQGSRTSYRLLMFSELFRRTARPGGTLMKKSLVDMRDELFARHGAPPYGAAAKLAAEVRRLHHIDSFPDFMREMGLQHIPSAEQFTCILRDTVCRSIAKGYSRQVLQGKLLGLRLHRDDEINRQAAIHSVFGALGQNWKLSDDHVHQIAENVKRGRLTFFPNRPHSKGQRGRRRSRG